MSRRSRSVSSCDSEGEDSVSSQLYANSERMREAAIRASLAAKFALMEELHALENGEAKMRQQREKLELRLQLEQARAKEGVFENFCEKKTVDSPLIGEYEDCENERERTKKPIKIKPELERTEPNSYEPHIMNQDISVERSSIELVRKMQLPTLQLQPFNGDPTQFNNFIGGFDSKIACRVQDEEERLYYLDQYTTGKPNDIVSSCLYMPPGEGYAEARRLLQERYGNVVQTVAHMIDKIVSWPSIRWGAEDLDKFAIFLRGTWNALKTMPRGINEIDAKTIRTILDKLNPSIKDRWRRTVDRIEYEETRNATFADLVNLLEREARINMNPSYGQQFDNQASTSLAASAASAPPSHSETRTLDNSKFKVKAGSCEVCEQGHKIFECPEFLRWTSEQRKNFIFTQGLCFGCLSKGHISKNCRNRQTCCTCQGKHPTVLHVQRETPDLKPGAATSCHLSTHQLCHMGAKLPIVSVLVKLGDKELRTSAFLDSGSTHSFCSIQLFKELGVVSKNQVSLNLTTVDRERLLVGQVAEGLTITDEDRNYPLDLPPLFTLAHIPVSENDVVQVSDIKEWEYLSNRDIALYDGKTEVGLLLGNDCGYAMEPLEVIPSRNKGPYAIRTRYGWIIGGARKQKGSMKVSKIQVRNVMKGQMGQEITDNLADTRTASSVEDALWCKNVARSYRRSEGKYEISLPFNSHKPILPNNYGVARKRLETLKAKFTRNALFAVNYKRQMREIITKGYAERASSSSDRRTGEAPRWYLPHHGVCHPHKPDKVRIVFDCAAKYGNVCLNDVLTQGPELTNSLMDVLLRFRQEEVAFMADISEMFLQVRVPEADRDYLRFLWWSNGDENVPPMEYRMTVRIFGARSSPSCANYAFRRTAVDFGGGFQPEVARTIYDNFYVDDCLKSVKSEEEAIGLIRDLRTLCDSGGFVLTKFVSNRLSVLETIPLDHRSKNVREIQLGIDQLPAERALGVHWDVETDTIGFNADVQAIQDRPLTRRGLFSVVSGMYDPLGLASPFVMRARLLLQELSRLKIDWDSDIPCAFQKAWKIWICELEKLTEFHVPRCFKITDENSVLELHYFADASEKGYGVAVYVRQVSKNGDVMSCSLLMCKSHVAPLKSISIPRLELCAAALAVKTNFTLERALSIPITNVYFWTDSTTVLKYIRNETARFQVFVANRLAVIHDGSSVQQWKYVPSAQNPADAITRGQKGEIFLENEPWRHGPCFLWSSSWPAQPSDDNVAPTDLEIRKVSVALTSQRQPDVDPISQLSEHYSSWTSMVRGVAWILKVKTALRKMNELRTGERPAALQLSLQDIQNAESVIFKSVQRLAFPQEARCLLLGENVYESSRLARLNPYIENGIIRVGGRLTRSSFDHDSTHPIILPSKTRATELIIQHVHENAGHEGRQHVLSDIRRKFWVLRANAEVRRVLNKCVGCRRRLRPPESQKMADLPEERLQFCQPPFFTTGIDCFGPFYVKKGRSQMKKYGVIFTCMSMRAVHLEIVDSLSTDSFICALRRFMSRRGQIRIIISDQGRNFVGAKRELKKDLKTLLNDRIRMEDEMLKRGIEWKLNPPGASRFGGAWERLIRSVRKILDALIDLQPLTDETLQTLMCEIEAIMNNRPLTPVSADHRDLEPLTPNHILLLQGKSPDQMCLCTGDELIGRKMWKQAQYLADQFWLRWRREYIPLLQIRPGSLTRSRDNLAPGDIVLLVDETVPRGRWPLGRIEQVRKSRDGLVRSARVKTKNSLLDRPITKLVKIVDVDWRPK